MNKTIIFLIILISITIGYGQKRVSLGIRGGYGITGAQFGILSEIKIIKTLSFQAEALYTINGQKSLVEVIDQQGYAVSTNYAITNSSYIHIPIQLKIKFGKKVKPYYMLGIAPTILTSSSARPLDNSNDIQFTSGDNFYRLNLTPGGGANNQKNVDLSSLSSSYSYTVFNTMGLEVDLGKIAPFFDLRLLNYLGKKNAFYSNVQFLVSAGIKF